MTTLAELRKRMQAENVNLDAAGGRTLVMTMQTELVKAAPAVVETELAIPAGFTQRN